MNTWKIIVLGVIGYVAVTVVIAKAIILVGKILGKPRDDELAVGLAIAWPASIPLAALGGSIILAGLALMKLCGARPTPYHDPRITPSSDILPPPDPTPSIPIVPPVTPSGGCPTPPIEKPLVTFKGDPPSEYTRWSG